ncbi:MAG: DNA double-strand break repair Rad50 ATPase [Methanomassiliicoccales archaeon PtaU1.Bin124]|nr:MAG: DNA double-strand break repair Rad50 ATPase [Methanomassiliicoccales archaeon PtaU1.Bin124]
MRIRSVELDNYRKFRHAALEVGDGVVGILGQNGSGKSTLVEAVAWAIYGNESSILRDGKDGVRWSNASQNEECRVTIDFDLESDHYRLSRWLKGKGQKVDASLEIDGMRIAHGDEAVTGEMVKRLGMDHKAFFVSVFARQKDLAALSALRPAERKKLVLSMLGIDQLDLVVETISADARSAKCDLDSLNAVIRAPDGTDRSEQARSELSRSQNDIARLSADESAMQAKLAEMEKYVLRAKQEMERAEKRSQQYQLAKSKVASLEADQRNMTARMGQIANDLKTLNEKSLGLPELEKNEEEHRRLDGERELLEDARVKHSQLTSLQQLMVQRNADIETYQKDRLSAESELAGLGDYETVIVQAEAAMQRHDEALQNAKGDAAWKIKEMERIQKEVREKRSKREEVHRQGPDSICPTCERRMDGQHDVLLRKLDQEIVQAEASLKELEGLKQKGDEFITRTQNQRTNQENKRKEALKLKERATGLLVRVRSSTDGMTRAQEEADRASRQIALLNDVKYDAPRYDQVRRRITELRPQVDRLMRLRTELQRRPPLEKESSDVQARLDNVMKELDEGKKALIDFNFDPEELRISRERYSQERDYKDAAVQSLSTLREEKARHQAAQAAARKRLEELEEHARRANELRHRQMELNVLLQVMKDFRANVTSRVLPTLAKYASELFVELTENKYGGLEIDDNYEIQVIDGSGTYGLSRFSGGEADLANLCLRLSISRLIAERSGQHVNFLVLDEIFGSQDSVRKRNILGLLSSLQRQFGQILLITHIDDIKDAVDNLVVVREQRDGSSLLGGDIDG